MPWAKDWLPLEICAAALVTCSAPRLSSSTARLRLEFVLFMIEKAMAAPEDIAINRTVSIQRRPAAAAFVAASASASPEALFESAISSRTFALPSAAGTASAVQRSKACLFFEARLRGRILVQARITFSFADVSLATNSRSCAEVLAFSYTFNSSASLLLPAAMTVSKVAICAASVDAMCHSINTFCSLAWAVS